MNLAGGIYLWFTDTVVAEAGQNVHRFKGDKSPLTWVLQFKLSVGARLAEMETRFVLVTLGGFVCGEEFRQKTGSCQSRHYGDDCHHVMTISNHNTNCKRPDLRCVGWPICLSTSGVGWK